MNRDEKNAEIARKLEEIIAEARELADRADDVDRLRTENERLRTSVKTLTGLLSYVGSIASGAAENSTRNNKIDGEDVWSLIKEKCDG